MCVHARVHSCIHTYSRGRAYTRAHMCTRANVHRVCRFAALFAHSRHCCGLQLQKMIDGDVCAICLYSFEVHGHCGVMSIWGRSHASFSWCHQLAHILVGRMFIACVCYVDCISCRVAKLTSKILDQYTCLKRTWDEIEVRILPLSGLDCFRRVDLVFKN